MARRAADHDRISSKLHRTTVVIDNSLMPFILAMAQDGKVSSGIRGCIRAAIFHQTKHGRLPAAYVKHLLEHDRLAAETYLAQYPEQAPEGFQRREYLAPDAFAGWDDPD